MNLDHRLRRELQQRSEAIDVDPAGPRQIISSARARTRRARIVGTVTVAVFMIGVAGAAIALRDSQGPADQIAATNTDDGAGTAEVESDAGADGAAESGDTRLGDDEELATTEPAEATAQAALSGPAVDDEAAASLSGSDEAQAADNEDSSSSAGASDDLDPESTAPGTATSGVEELVRYGSGFVALRDDAATLEFTTDGVEWTAVADPRPNRRSSITQLVSHDGVLYVAGDRPDGRGTRPWLAASDDLSGWTPVPVPTSNAADSDLTRTFTRIYSLAAGPAGLLVTGETIVDLRIEELLPEGVLDSGSWSLGDSSGDVGKVVVYDTNGDVEREIDLADAGVSQAVIDDWADGRPTPYVAAGPVGEKLQELDVDLPPGTVLVDGVVAEGSFISAGFSEQFSSRIVWQSDDAQNWTGAPVGVVANERADMIGLVDGRLTVFTSQGPILTVQQLRGDSWRETRLDPLFGNPNDDYLLVDAAFHDRGAAAVLATIGQSEDATLWLATTDDGTAWSIERLRSAVDTRAAIADVDSLAIDRDTIAVAFQTVGGEHRISLLDR